MKLISVIIGIIFCALSFCVTAGEETINDIRIVYENPPGSISYIHGYVEYEFILNNLSQTKTHRVMVEIPGKNTCSSYVTSIYSLSKSVILPPGASAKVRILCPSVGIMRGQGINMYIDGVLYHAESIGYFSSNTSYNYVTRIMTSLGFRKGIKKLYEVMNKRNSDACEYLKSNKDINLWSTNWLAYSSYDMICISLREFMEMDEGVRNAILDYMEAGGEILIRDFNMMDVPANELKVCDIKKIVKKIGKKINRSNKDNSFLYTPPLNFNLKRRLSNLRKAKKKKKQKPALFAKSCKNVSFQLDDYFYTMYYGFGTCHILIGRYKDVPPPMWSSLYEKVFLKGNGLRCSLSLAELNRIFKVVKTFSIPTRTLFILMLLFVLFIGPVNIVVLTRKKQRINLLWTIPVGSLIFTFCIILFAVLSEGFSPTIKQWMFTILDETRNRAVSLGVNAYYCPVAPGGGLKFSASTEITKLPNYRYTEFFYTGGDGIKYSINWDGGQNLIKGWIQSRVPTFFKIRKCEHRRERLEFKKTEKGLYVVNGLGCGIKRLYAGYFDGKLYYCEELKPGERKLMICKTTLTKKYSLETEKNFLSSQFEHWMEREKFFSFWKPYSMLPAGRYYALLEKPVFIETGIFNTKLTAFSGVVYGIMRGAEREEK